MRILRNTVAAILFLAILSIGFACSALAQNAPQASLRGVITDPSGARIPRATIQLRGPAGEQTETTDSNGQYAFLAIAPGRYDVEITSADFKTEQRHDFNINGATTLNVQLALERQTQVVTVQGDENEVSTDPAANASATVLGKNELEALSDDPDELARQLEALAGPGVGPQGGQIYTDGFTDGRVPPKSSIREIRINSNPYSAEYDSPGNNRVEILTKPSADAIHGQLSTQFNNEKLNTRSPLFAPSSLPPYKNLFWNGNIGGGSSTFQ